MLCITIRLWPPHSATPRDLLPLPRALAQSHRTPVPRAGAVTAPVELTKSAIQTATNAATALYEAPLEVTRIASTAVGGGASAAATAPMRAAGAATHGAVDAATGLINAPASLAAAAGTTAVGAGTAAATKATDAVASVIKGGLDAAAAAVKAPVQATSAVSKGVTGNKRLGRVDCSGGGSRSYRNGDLIA